MILGVVRVTQGHRQCHRSIDRVRLPVHVSHGNYVVSLIRALSCSVDGAMAHLAVLTENLLVTDGRIHGRSIYRASIALCGKKSKHGIRSTYSQLLGKYRHCMVIGCDHRCTATCLTVHVIKRKTLSNSVQY